MKLTYSVPPLGGLKKDLPSHLLERHMTPSANGVWSINGQLRRFPGKLRLVSGALDGSGGVMGIYLWTMDTGVSYLVAVTKTRTYYLASGSFVEIQPSDGDFTGGNADLFDLVPFFDSSGSEILVITNGVNSIKKWTGTGDIADLSGSPTKAKYLEVYANYLIAANMQGTPADPRQLVFSALGNGESWPAENFINLYGTADPIMRPKILRDSLVVYKAKSISVVDLIGGDLIFRLRENLINGLGLIGSRAVQTTPWGAEVHYFIGSDLEMYAFDLVERSPIGANISSVLSKLDPASWGSIVSVKSDEYDKLLWAIPGRGQSGNYDLLVLDLKTSSWWVREGEANRIFSLAEGKRTSTMTWDSLPYGTWDNWSMPEGWDSMGSAQANSTLILFGCADGRIRYWSPGVDDDGTDIDSFYTYPFDNLDGDDQTLKQVNKLILEVGNEGSGEIVLEIFTNSNDQNPVALDESGATSRNISLQASDSNQRMIVHEIDVAVKGYSFSFRLSSSSGEVWSGRLLSVEYEHLGDARV